VSKLRPKCVDTGQVEALGHRPGLARDAAVVEAHLAICPRCRREVAEQRRIDAEVRRPAAGFDRSASRAARKATLPPPVCFLVLADMRRVL